jgi:hypothetical protein
MRRSLLSLALIAGVVPLAAAHAAPTFAAPAVRVAPLAQTVQYYEPNWREHEYWRRHREEEERRREAWREHEWRERHWREQQYGNPYYDH